MSEQESQKAQNDVEQENETAAPDTDHSPEEIPEDTPLTPEEQLAALTKERDEFQDRWLRTQADLENLRKRSRKELEDSARYASLSLTRDLLPGLDNLSRALEAARQTGDVEKLTEGVAMVAQQFESILNAHSVVPISAQGQPFDPNLHEALSQIPSADHPPQTVLQEVEKGYMLHDRVVRPSKVIISMAPPEADTDGD